jgi:hypothetical protein
MHAIDPLGGTVMKYRIASAALALTLSLPWPALADVIQATLYKMPQCGCCEGHAAYLRENGFAVDIKETPELSRISAEAGIPPELEGCHTIFIDGYVVGGHVPAGVIKKMLSERPAIAGITLAGMPLGSPGMGGEKTEPFVIYAVAKDGAKPTVYATE